MYNISTTMRWAMFKRCYASRVYLKTKFIKPTVWFETKNNTKLNISKKNPWLVDSYTNQQIHTEGMDNPITSEELPPMFRSMPDSNRTILKNLNFYGYLIPSTVQQVMSMLVQQNQDFIVESPRSSGKSSGTLISVLNKIVSNYPVELMADLEDNSEMTKYPLACVILDHQSQIQIPYLCELAKIFSLNTPVRIPSQQQIRNFNGSAHMFLIITTSQDLSNALKNQHLSLKYCRYLIFDSIDFHQPNTCSLIATHHSLNPRIQKLFLGDFFTMESRELIRKKFYSGTSKQPAFISVGNVGALSEHIQYKFQFLHKLDDWQVHTSKCLKEAVESNETVLVVLGRLFSLRMNNEIKALLANDSSEDMVFDSLLPHLRLSNSKVLVCSLEEATALNIPPVSRLICFQFPSSIQSFTTLTSLVKAESNNPGKVEIIVRRPDLKFYKKQHLITLDSVREAMDQLNQSDDAFFDEIMYWTLRDLENENQSSHSVSEVLS